ncbi:MAG: SCP2 sterol-binding domain-containing protein [Spirochaetales bacterium]|nr:SCP2 sterol-binding domain-containing protein [Spirochaetales bacterium]
MAEFRNKKDFLSLWKAIIDYLIKDTKIGKELQKCNIALTLHFIDLKESLSIFACPPDEENSSAPYLTTVWGNDPDKKVDVAVQFLASVSNDFFQHKLPVMKALVTGKVKISGKQKSAMQIFNIMLGFKQEYINILKSKKLDYLIL